MLEFYLVSINKDNNLEKSILIYPSSENSNTAAKAEEIFLNECKRIDPKFATLDGDDIEDVLSEGYYETESFYTVCLSMIVNKVKV